MTPEEFERTMVGFYHNGANARAIAEAHEKIDQALEQVLKAVTNANDWIDELNRKNLLIHGDTAVIYSRVELGFVTKESL